MSVSNTNNSSIYTIYPRTDEEWSALYPKTEYPPKNTPELLFHYLIALNQPDKTILEYIPKKATHLTAKDTRAGRHLFTPLIIAAMRGRVEVIKALVAQWQNTPQKNASLNATDAHSWTALHHAAVSSREIYDILVEAGANTKALTAMRGMPEQIRGMITPNLPARSASTTFLRMEDKLVAISEVSQQALQAFTGLIEYRDEVYVPPESLGLFWQHNANLEDQDYDVGLYKTYLSKAPPSLIVQPCRELLGKSIHTLELVPEQDIPGGEVICDYSGAFVPSFDWKSFKQVVLSTDSAEYRAGDNIDAAKIGGAGRWPNHGFPNAYMIAATEDGINRSFLVSVETIKKEEPIVIDYGPKMPRELYCQPFILLGKEKMREFFKIGIDAIEKNFLELVEQVPKGKAQPHEVHNVRAKLSYPLSVPGAILDLHFSGLVSAKEWFKQLDPYTTYVGVSRWKMENNGLLYLYVNSVTLRIIAFEKTLAENQTLRTLAAQWIVDNIEKYSVMYILKAMDIISENPAANELNTAEIQQRLENYNWMEDQNAPLGFTRTSHDLLNINKSIVRDPRKLIQQLEMTLEVYRGRGEEPGYECYDRTVWMIEQIKASKK